MSADGRLALSLGDECPVRMFEFNGHRWQQVGKAILNTELYELTGTSVALSGDGNYLASASGIYAEIAKVFDVSNVTFNPDPAEDCGFPEDTITIELTPQLVPNPTTGILYFKNGTLTPTNSADQPVCYDVLGRELNFDSIQESSIDISSLAAGIYFLVIDGKCWKIVKVDL